MPSSVQELLVTATFTLRLSILIHLFANTFCLNPVRYFNFSISIRDSTHHTTLLVRQTTFDYQQQLRKWSASKLTARPTHSVTKDEVYTDSSVLSTHCEVSHSSFLKHQPSTNVKTDSNKHPTTSDITKNVSPIHQQLPMRPML